MRSASGACAAIVAAFAVALAPTGAGHAGVAAGRFSYPDVRAALPAPLAGAGSVAAPGAASSVGNISSAGSLNWAGYAVARHKVTFRLVRATFFVPYLNCADSPGKTMSSAWAGLDGYVGHPDSVEQIGIGANCSAAGAASYYAWSEMFPFAQRKLAIKIHPGDSVTAQVSYNSAHKQFRLSLTDHTRGEHATRVRTCPMLKVSGKRVTCPRSSAEVIAEAPAVSSASGLVISPLSDYGAISFADISVTDGAGQRGGIVSRHWGATKIIQVGATAGPPILAQPTSVQADMFDAYWLREG
jgi:hypothetical protein